MALRIEATRRCSTTFAWVSATCLAQPIADGAKLFFKEDITPSAVDRLIYFIAPAIAQDMADLITFLVSARANYISGAVIDENTGSSLYSRIGTTHMSMPCLRSSAGRNVSRRCFSHACCITA